MPPRGGGTSEGLPWQLCPSLPRHPSPLPTQSTMSTLPTFSFCCRSLAVMATELKKQNPLCGEEERAGRSA